MPIKWREIKKTSMKRLVFVFVVAILLVFNISCINSAFEFGKIVAIPATSVPMMPAISFKSSAKLLSLEDGGTEINSKAAVVSYMFPEIKMTNRKNVVIFYTTDFLRSSESGQYLTLVDLATKESKRYK